MTDRPITVPIDASTSELAMSAGARMQRLSTALTSRYTTPVSLERAKAELRSLRADLAKIGQATRDLTKDMAIQSRAAERERAA